VHIPKDVDSVACALVEERPPTQACLRPLVARDLRPAMGSESEVRRAKTEELVVGIFIAGVPFVFTWLL
jgi:hypothetical protein